MILHTASPHPAASRAEMVFLRIAGVDYAIPVLAVHGIPVDLGVCEVPCSAPGIRGMFCYREQVVPALDVRRHLREGGGRAPVRRVLVVEYAAQTAERAFAGLVLDGVDDVLLAAGGDAHRLDPGDGKRRTRELSPLGGTRIVRTLPIVAMLMGT